MLLHHPRFARRSLLCSLRGQWRPIGIKWYYKGSTSSRRALRPSFPHHDTTFYPSFGGRRAILQGCKAFARSSVASIGENWYYFGATSNLEASDPRSLVRSVSPRSESGIPVSQQYGSLRVPLRLPRQSLHAKQLWHCHVHVRGPLLPRLLVSYL